MFDDTFTLSQSLQSSICVFGHGMNNYLKISASLIKLLNGETHLVYPKVIARAGFRSWVLKQLVGFHLRGDEPPSAEVR